MHGSKKINKREFANTNWDIAGSGPRNLHISLFKKETNMLTEDLKGAKPQVVKFQSKRLYNDPLNPDYKIPEVQARPPTPPRFIRNAMLIDDIIGSKAKPDEMAGRKTKDVLKIDDIMGTRAEMRHRPRQRSGGYTIYDYNDVTKCVRRSMRCSNPLDPIYPHIDESGKLVEIGCVNGSKPSALPEPPKDRAKFGGSLATGDIAGA